MSEWHPIATAPIGVRVIVYEPGTGCRIGVRDKKFAHIEDDEGRAVWATHWMPLPDPPEGALWATAKHWMAPPDPAKEK